MIKPLAHPTHDITCAKCKHFFHTQAKLATERRGQMITREALLLQGENIAALEFRLYGPCTAGPGPWSLIDSEHWCGHYEGRDSF
jgi:hypothetical protein